MPRVWVSLGSNQDRERAIRGAIRALRHRYGPLQCSPVYETEAVGFQGQPFLNLVAGFETDESVGTLIQTFRAIEDRLGRVRTEEKFAPRTLDLDLLTYGALVGRIGGYRLPRDEILQYAFVLGPLADVAPDEVHPALGRSYGQLWQDFKGEMIVLRPVDFPLDLGIE